MPIRIAPAARAVALGSAWRSRSSGAGAGRPVLLTPRLTPVRTRRELRRRSRVLLVLSACWRSP